MIKRFVATVVNAGLLFLLVSMFMLPVALVYVASDTLTTPATVAGAKKTSSEITVLPNFFDFSEHVTFNLEPTANGFFDSLEATSFRSQLATYHKLYTVINRSDRAVTVRGVIAEKPEPSVAYQRLIITLAKNGQAHSALTVKNATQGDISMIVSDESVLEETDTLIIGDRVISVLNANGKMATVDPLDQEIIAGTAVYRNGVLVSDGKVYQSRTGDVYLEPGESLSVNMFITGRTDVDTQAVTIPFVITTIQD